jgi:hypothetical protein
MSYPIALKGLVVGHLINISNATNSTSVDAGVLKALPLVGDGANPFNAYYYQPGAREMVLDKGFNGGSGGVIVDEILGPSDIWARTSITKTDAGNTDVIVSLLLYPDKNNLELVILQNSSPITIKPGKEQQIFSSSFHGGIQAFSIAITSSVAGVYRINGMKVTILEILT